MSEARRLARRGRPGMALDPDKVRAIRAAVAGGTRQSDLAAAYKVSRAMICLVVARRKWAHVE